MTPDDARNTLHRLRLDPKTDFHRLGMYEVDALLTEADRVKYRKPKGANGSRGRYFHAYLCRLASRPE